FANSINHPSSHVCITPFIDLSLPTRRSSDLHDALVRVPKHELPSVGLRQAYGPTRPLVRSLFTKRVRCLFASSCSQIRSTCHPSDRKSTRLNSSHQIISYSVFCLKTKIL